MKKSYLFGYLATSLIIGTLNANSYIIDTPTNNPISLKDKDTLTITTNASIDINSDLNQTVAVSATKLSGDIENNGIITSISDYNASDGMVGGIVEENSTNSVKNSGTVKVTSLSNASAVGMANFYGISKPTDFTMIVYKNPVDVDTKGYIENQGIIDINSTVNAAGIIQTNGDTVNKGDIRVTTSGEGTPISEYYNIASSAIIQLGGKVINYGDITSVAYGDVDNIAINAAQADVENYGTINVQNFENNISQGYGSAYGVLCEGSYDTDLNETFINKGSISVSSPTRYNYGVSIEDYVNIHFQNDGNITYTATNKHSQDVAVNSVSDSNQYFENSGNILLYSSERGLDIGVIADSYGGDLNFINSGTIKSDTKRGVAEALLARSSNGKIDFINSGEIISNSTSSWSTALSLDSLYCDTNITNTGIIKASTNDKVRMYATAFYLNILNSNATFYNSGNITAYSPIEKSIALHMFSKKSDTKVINDGLLKADTALYVSGEATIKNGGVIETKSIRAKDSLLENHSLIHIKNYSTKSGYMNIGEYEQSNSGILRVDLNLKDDNGTLGILYPTITANNGISIEDGSTIDVNLISQSDDLTKSFLENNATLKDFMVSDKDINVTADKLNITDNSPILDFQAVKDNNDTSNILNLKAVKVEKLNSQDAPISSLSAITAGFQLISDISNTIQNRQFSTRGLNAGDRVFEEKGVWIKPFGIYTKQEDKNGINGFDANSYGFVIGSDGEYEVNKKAGIAFSYTNSDLSVNNTPQTDDIDTYSLSLYGSNPILDDKTTLFYQTSIGLQKNSSKRYISNIAKTASASFTSKTFLAQVSFQREYVLSDRFSILPTFTTTFRHIQTPSYSESGAGNYNLTINSSTANSLIASIKSDFKYKMGYKTLLTSSLSMDYDLNNKAQSLDVFFQGFPGIVYHTQGIKNSALELGLSLGISREIEKNLTLYLNYDFRAKGSDLTNHYGSLKIRWSF